MISVLLILGLPSQMPTYLLLDLLPGSTSGSSGFYFNNDKNLEVKMTVVIHHNLSYRDLFVTVVVP